MPPESPRLNDLGAHPGLPVEGGGSFAIAGIAGLAKVPPVGLSGSTVVEDGAVILGQAGAAGHLTVGADAIVEPQSGLHKDVAPGTRVLGNPQQEGRGFYRNMAALGRVRSLLRRVRAIERRLEMNAGDDDPGRT